MEMDKLDRWAEDRRNSLKTILNDLDIKLRDMKRDARVAPNLPAKLDLQEQLRRWNRSAMKHGENTMRQPARSRKEKTNCSTTSANGWSRR
jgi:hypothetical protein